MDIFLRTREFDGWLKSLRDTVGKARILARNIKKAKALLKKLEY